MIKYPKIHALGHKENTDMFMDVNDEIIIEEKMDGANFRCYIHNGHLIFGSHHCQLSSNEGQDTNTPKTYRKTISYIREHISFEQIKKYHNHLLFGECMVAHTLQYDWENILPFIGYDIWHTEQNRFFGYDEKKMIFDELGITMAHLIGRYYPPITSDINQLIPITAYPPKNNLNQLAEGIVIKNYTKNIFAKVVRDEFKEDNKKQFGCSKKNAEDGSQRIAFQFCTNARIEKQIFKMIDSGAILDMKMMVVLPKNVWNDIMEEEYHFILMSNDTFNPKEIRKIIATRCLYVLKQMITNNKIIGDDVDG